MEIRDLKKLSISNLILIILNDKNKAFLRKCAEIELKSRIRNIDWRYDDLLHFDDKVIKERGLDVSSYLISPSVNMQQLMETYFMFNRDTDYHSNYLLFSEKHLCNELDFAEPFFGKICAREIENISERMKLTDSESQRSLLLSIQQMLLERQRQAKQAKRETRKKEPIELLGVNEAFCQIDSDGPCIELLSNLSDEEKYKIMRSRVAMIKVRILRMLNDTLLESDSMQNLGTLKFVLNDSSKLRSQKRQLLSQVRNGYIVDYQTETMKKALQKTLTR